MNMNVRPSVRRRDPWTMGFGGVGKKTTLDTPAVQLSFFDGYGFDPHSSSAMKFVRSGGKTPLDKKAQRTRLRTPES
jgi:hypothetical protein